MHLQNPHDGSDIWYHGTLQRLPSDQFSQAFDDTDAAYFASVSKDAELLACRDQGDEKCSPVVYQVRIKLLDKKVLDVKNLLLNSFLMSDEGKLFSKTMLEIGGDDIRDDFESFIDEAQSYNYRAFDPTAHPFKWIADEFYATLKHLGYFGWFEKEEELTLGSGLNIGVLGAHKHIEVVGLLGV